MLENLPNVAYAEYEIQKARETEPKYIIERIAGKRTINGVKEILIKWKGYKTKTWEPKANYETK